MADFSKMKVVELKAELKRLGLPQNGLKAELVSRLEEATAAEEEPAAASEPPVEPTATKEPDEAPQPDEAQPDEVQPSEAEEAANKTEEVTDAPEFPTAESAQETPVEAAATIVEDSPVNGAAAQTASNTLVSETPSLPTTEVIQDIQKRKRRSTTPPPSEEVVRKRLRPDDTGTSREESVPEPIVDSHEASRLETEDVNDAPMVDANASTEQHKESTKKVPEPDEKDKSSNADLVNHGDEPEDEHVENSRGATTKTDVGHLGDPEDNAMFDSGATRDDRGAFSMANDALDHEMRDTNRTPSPERDIEPSIEPSIHPATCALYIKDFMRPLRERDVQNHLLELATPANSSPDPSVIVNFYLDSIRTHAFAVFTSISAASRVRTALHQQIWPDETNRKPLWIDFIPSEYIEDWIATELEAKDKGTMPRYEVVYDRDVDNNVVARLEEADAHQATRRAPVSPVHPDRRPSVSIPTGPSRPSGIENAPTGPRNPYAHNGPPAMYPDRQTKLEAGFIRTKTNPPVLFRPVPPELANRRLDSLAQAKDPHYFEESGKDYHRYYFEGGDSLVNRGPEIFLGIRPPHREKERREQQQGRAGGVDVRDRGYRDRRGPFGPPGGGGGRQRRRRAPRAPHGVPRGGDRFRPAGSSYEDRPGFDDRRRDDYGGNGRRKDNYRY
ncbi:hypothetical protein F5Y03DRAFT_361635 [Xylaria venustula]|nr:hypothetical protein F5Y03DRAFT_361635 [Xylaria venustula]